MKTDDMIVRLVVARLDCGSCYPLGPSVPAAHHRRTHPPAQFENWLWPSCSLQAPLVDLAIVDSSECAELRIPKFETRRQFGRPRRSNPGGIRVGHEDPRIATAKWSEYVIIMFIPLSH